MALIYIDPLSGSNGAGTFISPRNSVPTSLAYGDKVLIKEGTILEGGWTVPTPSGVGSIENFLYIGTYDKNTGEILETKTRLATIKTSNNTSGILLSSVSYVTIAGLAFTNVRDFPEAAIRSVNSSYITVRSCVISSQISSASGGYGIRLSNDTGAGSPASSWTITNNTIYSTSSNSAIYLVWGANINEYVTDIIVSDNIIYGNSLDTTGGGNYNAISLVPRAASVYLDRAGFCSKGVQILRNSIFSPRGYGINVGGIEAGGSFSNLVSENRVYNTNPQRSADAHCIWFGACSDTVVEKNLVYISSAFSGASFGTGVGIFIDMRGFGNEFDGCFDMIVRYNHIYSTGQQGELNLEVGGAGILVFLSWNIKVYSNLIENCSNGIVVIGWYDTGNIASNVSIFNNTVLNSTNSNFYVCRDADSISLHNNIAVGGLRGYYIENTGAGTITNYVETHNLSWGASQYNWCGGNEPSVGAVTISNRTPSGTNLTENPLLQSLWFITENSPAKNSGYFLQPALDFFQTSFFTPPSRGAFEYMPVRSITSTRTMRT